MVTLTFDKLGLILACAVIFAGLVIPTATSEGDNWAGVAYAACIVIIACVLYLMAVGLGVVLG